MSSWPIRCTNGECDHTTKPANIAELLNPANKYLDDQGWFVCEQCGTRGYIKKEYDTQEGEKFIPHLKAILRPSGYKGDSYQPFAFLASNSPSEQPEAVWFVYFKDTRNRPGGLLKMGYGPGGPPYFDVYDVLEMMVQMVRAGALDAEQVIKEIRSE